MGSLYGSETRIASGKYKGALSSLAPLSLKQRTAHYNITDPLLSKMSCSPLQRQTSKPLSPVLQAIMLFRTQKKWLVILSSRVLPPKLQCSLFPVKWLHYKHVQGELWRINWTSGLICLTLPAQFRRKLLHLCPLETVLCPFKFCEYLAVI